MTELWKMIIGSAHELDVQVFATTHSSDCIKSLGEAASAEEQYRDDVSLQRVNASKRHSTAYSEAEIEIASQNEIEVR